MPKKLPMGAKSPYFSNGYSIGLEINLAAYDNVLIQANCSTEYRQGMRPKLGSRLSCRDEEYP
jgi:hypothetical protein